MPLPEDSTAHPSPSKVMEFAGEYAELLRSLMDPATPPALIFASDFVQKTYVEYVIPWLPDGATRKCKLLANPWAHADPGYRWEWEWDAASGTIKGAGGEAVEFPRFPPRKAAAMIGDLFGRGFLAKKAILENGTDPKAAIIIGGPFDFGEDVRRACRRLG